MCTGHYVKCCEMITMITVCVCTHISWYVSCHWLSVVFINLDITYPRINLHAASKERCTRWMSVSAPPGSRGPGWRNNSIHVLSLDRAFKDMNHSALRSSREFLDSWKVVKRVRRGNTEYSSSCVDGRYSRSPGTRCEGEEGYKLIQTAATKGFLVKKFVKNKMHELPAPSADWMLLILAWKVSRTFTGRLCR